MKYNFEFLGSNHTPLRNDFWYQVTLDDGVDSFYVKVSVSNQKQAISTILESFQSILNNLGTASDKQIADAYIIEFTDYLSQRDSKAVNL